MNKVSYDERKKIYNSAAKKYGTDIQMTVAIEEMAELQKEICKLFRGKRELDDLVDEIADVTVMLEQLRIMFGINDEVCERMDYKVLRLQHKVHPTDESETEVP